jgi:hypothetical protein
MTTYRKIVGAQMYNVSREVENVVAEPIALGVKEMGVKLSLTCEAQISVCLPRKDARELAEFILEQTEEG